MKNIKEIPENIIDELLNILNEAKEPKVTYDMRYCINNNADNVLSSLHHEAIEISQYKIDKAIELILKYK